MMVSADPKAVLSVCPFVSSRPFSITRRDPLKPALLVTVTSPASCKSPHTIPLLAIVGEPVSVMAVATPAAPQILVAGNAGSCGLLGSCGNELEVEPQVLVGMELASD